MLIVAQCSAIPQQGLFDANELSNFDHTNNAGGMNAAGRNAWGAYFDSWSPGSRLLYGNEYARRTVAEHSRASNALHVTAMAWDFTVAESFAYILTGQDL